MYNHSIKRGEGEMIYKFSGYLTRLLCKESMISDDQEELYDYGFQITIANMTNFVIALLTGICFHAVIEMAFIYCIFVSLRFFCGGYHADTYGKCFLLFAVTCMTCLGWRSGLPVIKKPGSCSFRHLCFSWVCAFGRRRRWRTRTGQ